MLNLLTKAHEKLTAKQQHKARFVMSYGEHVYSCEECDGIKFRKVSKTRARCADEDCGVVYSVDYPKLDIDIIYYTS